MEIAPFPRPAVRHRTVVVAGLDVFYREAGNPAHPTILLLHGFPSSSHMFRDLLPLLADRYHVVAPDLPGFGFSDAPARAAFAYTFDHLAEVIGTFTEAVGLTRYALYVFDYGAPVGFRLALAHPERVTALISQNGNAYAEGLSAGWNPIQRYWQQPTAENREALRALLARPGQDELQLDLFGDYQRNVALYPRFQAYFRTYQPPTLAVWGQHDPFFLSAGAEAYRRDNPAAEVHLLDTGHFALETHAAEIAGLIRNFLARVL
jgi:pimeloyl-ACP methyl ester carboxylesterase